MKKLIVLAVLLALVMPAWAQYHHDSERHERIAGIIADCERRTDEFKVAFAHALDRSRVDGTYRERELNFDASRLENAMDALRQSWNRYHDYERSRDLVGAAISAAQDINRTLARHYLNSFVQEQWTVLRNEVDRLADVFRQRRIEWASWEVQRYTPVHAGHGGTEYRDRDRDRSENIAGIIADCERRTDEFKRAFARALDRSRLDGTYRERELNFDASKLENAMDALKQSWNRYRNYERSRELVGAALSAARDIDRSLSRHSLRSYINREWETLRAEVDELAEIFNHSRIEWNRW
jgi:hypothetical protein